MPGVRTIPSDRLRAGTAAAGVVGGLLSGLTGDYGDADGSRSRVLSANYAFGVWAPIYAGSLAYVVDGLRPSRRRAPLLRRTGWPAAAAYALAGTWVWLQRPPVLQLPAVAATTAAAATAYARARPRDDAEASSALDRRAVRVPPAGRLTAVCWLLDGYC
jgi:hypothetical protein